MIPPGLELKEITKRFGPKEALAGLSLAVPKGSLIVLLGPAGAGKTTTLRIVAGLDLPSSGTVMIEGEDVTRWQPNERDVAMIFDNLALYPNLSGFENIAFPLRLARRPEEEIKRTVHALAELLRIEHILHRRPETFSGGERQRVALGRAMVREPRLYLLDEPLSNLDFMLRIDLRTEIKRLQRERGNTYLFATPDYTEALALADTVCVLLEGRVRQLARAQEIYDAPVDSDVARFVGNPPMNIVPASLDRETGQARVRIGRQALPLPPAAENRLPASLSEVELGIRPEHIEVVNGARAGAIPAVLADVEPLGMHTTLGLEIDGVRLLATAPGEREFVAGQSVRVRLHPEKLHFFDPATGLRIPV